MLFFKLSGFYFFYFAAVGVYIIFLPKVLHDIGYTPTQIGILLALAPLMRFATPFLFLKKIALTQKLFKGILVASVVSSFLFYLTIEHFYLFMINNGILGVCLSVLLPYIELIAIRELGSLYGKSRLFGSIGFAVISLVLAVYLSKPDVALHYYFGTTLVTAFFGWRLLAYDKESKTQEERGGEFSLLSYWSFWVSLFLMQVSFGGYYNFFTLYESGFGIDLETISYLWVFAIVCEILIFYYQAPLLKRNLLLIIKFALLATTLRWVLLHFFGDHLWVVFVTQAFHALSFGLYHSAVILYLYEIYENKKLAQQFMLGIAYGLGGFVGAILAGYIYGEYLFLISGIISFGAFLFLYFDRMLQK